MMHELRQQNERLRTALDKKTSLCNSSTLKSAADKMLRLKQEIKTLMEINTAWKQDYERLGIQYKMLQDEKERLEGANRYFKELANKLELKRRIFIERENQRLAAVRQCRIG